MKSVAGALLEGSEYVLVGAALARDLRAQQTRYGSVDPELVAIAERFNAIGRAWRAAQTTSDFGSNGVPFFDILADGPETVTVREAAALLGTSDRWVRELLRQGRLQGRKCGRPWIVSGESVERYREATGVGGVEGVAARTGA